MSVPLTSRFVAIKGSYQTESIIKEESKSDKVEFIAVLWYIYAQDYINLTIFFLQENTEKHNWKYYLKKTTLQDEKPDSKMKPS